jgi:hypothetical protein
MVVVLVRVTDVVVIVDGQVSQSTLQAEDTCGPIPYSSLQSEMVNSKQSGLSGTPLQVAGIGVFVVLGGTTTTTTTPGE